MLEEAVVFVKRSLGDDYLQNTWWFVLETDKIQRLNGVWVLAFGYLFSGQLSNGEAQTTREFLFSVMLGIVHAVRATCCVVAFTEKPYEH